MKIIPNKARAGVRQAWKIETLGYLPPDAFWTSCGDIPMPLAEIRWLAREWNLKLVTRLPYETANDWMRRKMKEWDAVAERVAKDLERWAEDETK